MTAVLQPTHVADPMHRIFDRPVPAQQLRQPRRRGRAGGQVGDPEPRLVPTPGRLTEWAPTPAHPSHLLHVRPAELLRQVRAQLTGGYYPECPIFQAAMPFGPA